MNRDYGNAHYTTFSVNDRIEGCAGLELYRIINGEKKRVARVIFWDASGQFFFETFNVDLPLEIVEQLIAETKAFIRIR
jgi:hypothetical protein